MAVDWPALALISVLNKLSIHYSLHLLLLFCVFSVLLYCFLYVLARKGNYKIDPNQELLPHGKRLLFL